MALPSALASRPGAGTDRRFPGDLQRSPLQPGKVVLAKNQNTFEKRRREMDKKHKAAEKRRRRRERKDRPDEPDEPSPSEDLREDASGPDE